MKSAIAKHPLITFVVIAFAWTWPLALLIDYSLALPLLGLFGPAVAAIVVIWASEGRTGLAKLVARFKPSRPLLPWIVVAILLPVFMLGPMWLLNWWWWGYTSFQIGKLSMIGFLLAVLIVGEEIGWRGFLLPHFLKRHGPFASALVVGEIWALWHLPNFLLPAYPHYGISFFVFVIIAISYSVLFTWFYLKTGGSLLLATIFHAALNLLSLGGIDPGREYWIRGAVYAVLALAAGAVIRKFLVSR